MARFEKDGLFVEVWLVDGDPWPEVWRREGAIGDDAVAEKLPLQYAFGGRDRFVEIVGEHARAGWKRVRDPEREDAVVGEPWNPRLVDQLRAGDLDAALVLGDALEEAGHPRGALIAIQHAREERPTDDELRAREAKLFEDHGDVLLGPLAPHVGTRGQYHEAVIELRWKRGFIERAHIDGFFDRGTSEQIAWDLLRHPSGRFLRELVIGCHHPGDQDNMLMADLIACADPAPPLRRLFIGDFDDTSVDQIDISRAPIGSIAGLAERYPMLEEVIVKGTGDVSIGDVAMPSVKHFAIRTSTLVRRTLDAVVELAWPALEDLELWFGEADYGAECDASDVKKIVAIDAPKLRVLRLMNADFTDELIDELPAAFLARLETLDLSLGTLTGVGADRIVKRANDFAHLKLVVFDCALDDPAIARLRDAKIAVDETPCSPAEATCLGWRQASRPTDYRRWRRPRCTQKTERFVSVGE